MAKCGVVLLLERPNGSKVERQFKRVGCGRKVCSSCWPGYALNLHRQIVKACRSCAYSSISIRLSATNVKKSLERQGADWVRVPLTSGDDLWISPSPFPGAREVDDLDRMLELALGQHDRSQRITFSKGMQVDPRQGSGWIRIDVWSTLDMEDIAETAVRMGMKVEFSTVDSLRLPEMTAEELDRFLKEGIWPLVSTKTNQNQISTSS